MSYDKLDVCENVAGVEAYMRWPIFGCIKDIAYYSDKPLASTFPRYHCEGW